MIGSVTHTPSWALWTALGLGIFDLALWVFVVWFAHRTWKQLKPALLPYVQMLMPSQNVEDREVVDSEFSDYGASGYTGDSYSE